MPDYQALEEMVEEVSAIRRQLEQARLVVAERGFDAETSRSWLEWCESTLPELDELSRRYGEFNFTLVEEGVSEEARQVFLPGLDGINACRLGVAHFRDVLSEVVVPLFAPTPSAEGSP